MKTTKIPPVFVEQMLFQAEIQDERFNPKSPLDHDAVPLAVVESVEVCFGEIIWLLFGDDEKTL